MTDLMYGTEGQDQESYTPVETAECRICGGEYELEALQDGLCRICREHPEGSFEWHLGMFFEGCDPIGYEYDAFESGWRRAEHEAEKKIKTLTAALEEIKRNCDPWKTADNMAGRLFNLADYAIRTTKEEGS